MRSRNLLACAVLTSASLAGCGNDPLPAGMVGGFARDVTYPDGNHRLRLDITPTGMTVTGGPGTQTIPVAGSPSANGVVKVGASGSALYKTMKCFNDFSCRFTTENGCDGTFTRDSSGSIVLVATGDCETWSGKWLSEKDAVPLASTSASATATPSGTASAGPAALPQGVPTATASGTPTAAPSGTATASGTASGAATALPTSIPTHLPTAMPTAANVTCLSKCNDTNMACVRECKVSDLDCMKACSAKLVTCAQACQ